VHESLDCFYCNKTVIHMGKTNSLHLMISGAYHLTARAIDRGISKSLYSTLH